MSNDLFCCCPFSDTQTLSPGRPAKSIYRGLVLGQNGKTDSDMSPTNPLIFTGGGGSKSVTIFDPVDFGFKTKQHRPLSEL